MAKKKLLDPNDFVVALHTKKKMATKPLATVATTGSRPTKFDVFKKKPSPKKKSVLQMAKDFMGV